MSNPTPGKSLPGRRDLQLGHPFGQREPFHRLPLEDALLRPGDYALVEDIYARGLDKKVLLVVTGEFGRTPYVEYGKPGRPGRGHHPGAMSILVSGGGMRIGPGDRCDRSEGRSSGGSPA